MANKPGHRRFGSIRRRESGRYQVRYYTPDGQLRTAPETFARKSEAERYLTLLEAEITRREWIDPDLGKVSVGEYVACWITERPKLSPRTVELYRQLLRTHIVPTLGEVLVADLTTSRVRLWRSRLLSAGVSQTVAAKAYRLLRAAMNTALREDGMIRVNPCRVPGADREDAEERPILTVAQVLQVSELVPARYKALVLLTTFACLRWGEVTALHREDVDLDHGTVRVTHAFCEIRGKGLVLGPPKTRAGVRTVGIPDAIFPVLRRHLRDYVEESPQALVFTGPSDGHPPLRRNNFRKLVGWEGAVAAVGAPGLHFHDLRHTGNVESARAGVSTRDLMARMGHESPRAALRYQHATAAADRTIADSLSDSLRKVAKDAKKAKKKARAEDAGDPAAQSTSTDGEGRRESA